MNLITNLIFLVIFGVIGYILNRIFDFNPYDYWTKFGAISLILSLLLAYIPVIFNPMDVVGNIERLMKWFVDILPGTIIGDIAGPIVSNLTGGRR